VTKNLPEGITKVDDQFHKLSKNQKISLAEKVLSSQVTKNTSLDTQSDNGLLKFKDIGNPFKDYVSISSFPRIKPDD